MDKLVKLLRFSVNFTLVLLCVRDVTNIVNEYFSYNEDITITVEIPRITVMPVISFEILQESLISKRFKARKGSGITEFLKSNMTEDELFRALFVSCNIDLKGDGNQLPCLNLTKVTVRFRNNLWLSLFETNYASKQKNGQLQYFNYGEVPLIQFRMNYSNNDVLNFYLSTRNMCGNRCGEPFGTVFFNRYSCYTVFTIKTKRLRSPYPSKCVDFAKLGFVDKRQCTLYCLVYFFWKLCKIRLTGNLVLLDRVRKHYSYKNPKQCAHYYEIERRCMSLCARNECTTVSYDFKQREAHSFQKKHFCHFVIERSPNEININIQYIIHLSKLSALAYIAGYLGMWFGISIFSCLVQFRNFLESNFFFSVIENLRTVMQPNRVIFLQEQHEDEVANARSVKKKRIAFAICVSLLLVGYSAQCIDVLNIYVNRDFSVYLKVSVSTKERLPAFTFLVKNILNQSITFIECIIYDELGNYDNCSKKTPNVVHFFKDYISQSYFLITKTNKRQIMYSTEQYYPLLMFNFQKDSFPFQEINLLVHSAKSLPTIEHVISKKIIYAFGEIQNYPKFCLSMQLTLTKTFKLLKSPFRTKCKDVSTVETSKQSCIKNCIVHHLGVECALRHTFIQAVTPRRRNLKNCKEADAVVKKCYYICEHNDCERLEYELEYQSIETCKQLKIVVSRKPMKNKEIYELQPKFTVIDLFFYISGCLCLWFGISIMATLRATSDSLVRISSHLATRCYNRLNILVPQTRSIIHIAIITISCIACIQQVSKIITVYIRYETMLQKSSTAETDDTFPAFSFYEIPKKPVIHYSKAAFSKSNFNKYFQYCYLLNELTGMPESICGNLTQSLLGGYILHSFRNGNNLKVKFNFTSRTKPKVGVLFKNATFLTFLAFHNIGDSRSVTSSSNFLLKFVPRVHYILTFKRITTRSLPVPCPPYCQCYKDIGFDNREDCIEKCRIKLFLKRCKTFPFNSLWINGLHNRLSFEYNYYRYCKEKESIDNICSKHCPLSDCKQKLYSVENLGYKYLGPRDGTSVIIQLPRRSFCSSFERSLRYSLVDVFVYIGNAIGLWLGLSIYLIVIYIISKLNDMRQSHISRRLFY